MVEVQATTLEGADCRMSALGQKPTYALQQAMSALPPIATSIAFFGMSALGHKRTQLQLVSGDYRDTPPQSEFFCKL